MIVECRVSEGFTVMYEAFEPFFEDHRAETAFIHESSFVDSPCRIGEHTSILHFSHVMAHTIIGSRCHVGRNVTIASGVFLGDQVRVMNNAQLNPGVIMENDVTCGPGVVFIENRHVRAGTRNISRVSPTLVRRGAQIGPNVTVASGFTIGRFAFIEAGTVVDRNIPDFAVACGNPLMFAGWRCECGQVIDMPEAETEARHEPETETRCTYCGRTYLRHAKWKLMQLTGGGGHDSHIEPDATGRTAEGAD